MYLNSTYVQERGHHEIQNSVVGTAGENRQYNYSAFANLDKYSNNGTKTTGGANDNWTAPWTSVGGSLSAGNGYQQYGMNLSGGAIAYGDGVVFTPIMGDTMAVVEAEHAAGARITNNNSLILSLGGSGKAAVPYLIPYRQNTIELVPKGLSNNVSLDVTSQNSVATAGAVVLLKYKTDVGHSVLFTVQHSSELPFGAVLVGENNNTVGYIAQGGQSFACVKTSRKRCGFSGVMPSASNAASAIACLLCPQAITARCVKVPLCVSNRRDALCNTSFPSHYWHSSACGAGPLQMGLGLTAIAPMAITSFLSELRFR